MQSIPSFALRAAAAGLLAIACASAFAQKAAIVQSVDEPARSPYQQSIIFNQSTSTCTTYVGGAPVTLFVEAGHNPTVSLEGYNLSSSSTSARVMVVGHLVSPP